MRRYPSGLIEFVEENYKTMDLQTMTGEINKRFSLDMSTSAVSSLKKRRGLTGSPRVKIYSDVFPKEVSEFIKANCKGTGYKEMCAKLKKEFGMEYTPQQIKSFYHNKDCNSGLTGHFIKGMAAYNKGKKVSPEAYRKSAATMFKPGNRPHNILPLGTEIINGEGYHRTKIAEPDKWEFTHKLIWEKYNGPIPKGMCVAFKDDDRNNITIENLMLISKEENGYLNCTKLKQVGPEYMDTAVNIARVALKVNHRRKKTTDKDKTEEKK